MKTYDVQIEMDVHSVDLGIMQIEASSRQEAVDKAITLYYSDNAPEIDFWASDYIVTELSTSTKKDWDVTEVETA